MTILQAAARLRAGSLSSMELTQSALQAIARLNGRLNAFLTVTEEQAVEAALRADDERSRGIDRGPLHGIPVAFKDVFATRGVRTTCGSPLFRDYVPDADCAVVERLLAAGAVPLGKLNMHELAYGITSSNPHFGPVRNPWDLERIPGGSSGGSGAAVAAGMVFMAMGSDTGGSIRIPASYCGTVGLKPTSGRVSRFGVLPLDFSLDHMGPLARSVRDAALTLSAIAGHDPRDLSSSRAPVKDYLPGEAISLHGIRVGVPEGPFYQRTAEEVRAAAAGMARTAESLGAAVMPVRLPDMEAVNAVARVILLCEASAVMEKQALANRGAFGADVIALIDQGRLVPATDYINAQRLRRVFIEQFREVWRQVDCLFTPATPISAPRIGEAAVPLGGGMNLIGAPALSIPCGFDANGMPLGLQIIGRPFEEDLILRVGAALEDATDFHLRRPALA